MAAPPRGGRGGPRRPSPVRPRPNNASTTNALPSLGGFLAPMRARAAFAVLLLVASGLAGCLASTGSTPAAPSSSDAADLGAADPSAAGPSAAPGDGPGRTPGGVGSPVTVDGEANHETVVRNGTFTAFETCLPAGCFTGAYEQGLDLTEKLPVGVPTTINVTLTYDEATFNYVGLALDVEGAAVYHQRTVGDPGENVVWLEATVARLNPQDEVVVQAQAFYPDDGTTDYRMEAQVGAHPDLVTARAPMEIPVPAEAGGFTLGFTGARGSFDAMVWGPADDLVGHYQVGTGPGQPDNVTVRLDPDHDPGSYVVLVRDVDLGPGHTHAADDPHHHHGVRAATLETGVDVTMEALDLEYRSGGTLTASHGETVTWDPHFSRAPVQAGIVASPIASVTVNPGTLSGFLRSPQGTVVDFSGHGYLLGFGGYGWFSPVGADALSGGPQKASFTNAGGTSLEVTQVAGFYQR